MNKVVRFALSDVATTAALGINVTNADINAKVEAGAFGLAVYGGTNATGCCVDCSGNIYISDFVKHAIYKIDEGGNTANLFAGLPGTSGHNGTLQNVAAGTARFNAPAGLACDKSNNIYVADTGNNQIRVINSGRVSVLAGDRTAGLVDTTLSTTNGPLAARFDFPVDVDVDAKGVVYVCERDNHAIRKIEGGKVLTIAGDGSAGDLEDVQALGKNASYFSSPRALCVDADGAIYVSDTGNLKVKKITTNGWVYLHSGSGVSGRSLGDQTAGSGHVPSTGVADSNPFTCEYVFPFWSAVDKSGNLYIIDKDAGRSGTRLISIDKDGVPNVIADFNGSDGDNSASVAVSPGQKLFVTMNV
ncbi:MAG TPA: hypothetical protein VMV86_05010 [Methanosarcinales archaeon]|nr:hypothetical protein [Methanosarcinales archaeon]